MKCVMCVCVCVRVEENLMRVTPSSWHIDQLYFLENGQDCLQVVTGNFELSLGREVRKIMFHKKSRL